MFALLHLLILTSLYPRDIIIGVRSHYDSLRFEETHHPDDYERSSNFYRSRSSRDVNEKASSYDSTKFARLLPQARSYAEEDVFELNVDILFDPVDLSHYYKRRAQCAIGENYSVLLKKCLSDEDKNKEYESFCENGCNSGRCVFVDEINDVACQCLIGHYGLQCTERKTYCNQTTCPSGQCIEQVGLPVCACPTTGNSTLYGSSCDRAEPIPCVPGVFKRNFKHLMNRIFHPYGDDKIAYIQCSNDKFIIRRCPLNTFWDQDMLYCTPLEPLTQRFACRKYPCLNYGRCYSENDDDFKCFCREPYEGRYCQLHKNYCNVPRCGGSLINGRDVRCINTDTEPFYACACDNGIVDDCCCHNITNKCTANDLKAYAVDQQRYIQCTEDGIGYLMNCPYGTVFNSVKESCISFDEDADIRAQSEYEIDKKEKTYDNYNGGVNLNLQDGERKGNYRLMADSRRI